MTDPVRRRGFLEFTGTSLAALLVGGTQPQVDDLDVSTLNNPEAFDSFGLLLGPEAARPPAGGPYLSEFDEYRFVYISTDTGGRFVIETGDTAWLDISPVIGTDILTEPVTVVDDSTEVFVYEAAIPANQLRAAEQHRLRLHGQYSTDSTSQTFQLRFYINGIEVGSTTSATGLATDVPVRTTFVFTVQSIGTTGQVQPYIEATFNNVNEDSTPAQVTLDTTETANIRASIQWGTASVDNEFILEQASHELVS